ncbi:MAG: type II toxin-antitoxin system RelB/DinJ family antitoxin [Chlamydiae bacterium]|nr:type II toxin-antitoxin system RelB/DinJ family antitoxin [Chlamydiota bacterium]MBI3265969.1 type II toxin-antitoxin system RelB/DinJ family antitoxin [Chlamydiota bacterium]
MSRTAMIRARTESYLKNAVERILHTLGLSASDAINLFYRQIELQKGLPFDVKIPNRATLRAVKDVQKKHRLTRARDAKDMFKKLGI